MRHIEENKISICTSSIGYLFMESIFHSLGILSLGGVHWKHIKETIIGPINLAVLFHSESGKPR